MSGPRRAGHPLWIAYEMLAMLLGLGALAVLCLLWLPCALLLRPLLPRPTGQALGRRAIMYGFRFYLGFLQWFCACRFDLAELDRLRDAGPLIVAANHPSLLDVVLIASRLPDAVCVIKAALLDRLLLGAAARLAGYIRNDAPLEMLLQARAELRDGAQLVIFPEGSRTAGRPLDPLAPGCGLLAWRAATPVQTLLIEFSAPYLGKGWPLFRRPLLPLHCRIRLGRRFPPPAEHAAFTRELAAYFRVELGQNTASTATGAA